MARAPRRDVALLQLLPNALTLTAIGAGLSAIRAAVEHDFKTAALLLLFAALLGGHLLGEKDRGLRIAGAVLIAAGVMALGW